MHFQTGISSEIFMFSKAKNSLYISWTTKLDFFCCKGVRGKCWRKSQICFDVTFFTAIRKWMFNDLFEFSAVFPYQKKEKQKNEGWINSKGACVLQCDIKFDEVILLPNFVGVFNLLKWIKKKKPRRNWRSVFKIVSVPQYFLLLWVKWMKSRVFYWKKPKVFLLSMYRKSDIRTKKRCFEIIRSRRNLKGKEKTFLWHNK